MKSSINVRYNVYAPKAERNRTTNLNRVTRTVYLLGSQFKLPCGTSSLEQMRLLGHANTKQRCEIQLEWNAWIQRTLAEQEKHCLQRDSQKAFQSTHRHYLAWIYCNVNNTHCAMLLWQKCGIFTLNFITGVMVYNYGIMYVCMYVCVVKL